MNDLIRLAANFSLEDKELVLRYQASNHGSHDAYLLNRLYRSVPSWDMSPNVIYVDLDPKGRAILLSKKLADLPTGINITTPVAPYVTPLRAGSLFHEEVHIALPVTEYRQYPTGAPPKVDKPRLVTYEYVSFTLGYYWRPEGTEETTKEIQGTPVIIPRTPPGKPLDFGQAETGLTRLDIPVVEP
jgi:hypothetical protein